MPESKAMIYRCPGRETLHGVKCESRIVPISERDALLEDGWSESPILAHLKATKPKQKVADVTPASLIFDPPQPAKKRRGRKPKKTDGVD